MGIWDCRHAIKTLRSVGFSLPEIIRLLKWRRSYRQGQLSLTLSEYRRLEFARWLIVQGETLGSGCLILSAAFQ
jgi:DNA-binding transcriptional MerR regulator